MSGPSGECPGFEGAPGKRQLPASTAGQITNRRRYGVAGSTGGKSERDSIDGACAEVALAAIHEALELAD